MRAIASLFILSIAWWSGAGTAHAQRQAGETFRDCETCPQMVVVPAGTFQMGSTEAETSREGVPNLFAVLEKPVHPVTIPKPFAAAKFAVTWAEFNAFSRDTGVNPTGCWYWDTEAKKTKLDEKRSWKDPGFPQTDLSQPVVCVSWDDAKKYTAWLSTKTGQAYRLLTEAEWEYAARAGTKTARYWGDAIGSGNANCDGCGSRWGAKQTAPSGSFRPNSFGLYDMIGNAWQWTEDCWHEGYEAAPADGTAWTTGDCKRRVVRGGSWIYLPWNARAAIRYRNESGYRSSYAGFRVARTLP